MSSLKFLDEDPDEAATQGNSVSQTDSLQDQDVSIKRNARSAMMQETPAAPRNNRRSKPADMGFGGFSSFVPANPQTKDSIKEVSNAMQEENLFGMGNPKVETKDSTNFGDGATTRRNNTSAQMSLGGGFSARISELKLDTLSFSGNQLFQDEDAEECHSSEQTPDSSNLSQNESPSNFTYKSQAELTKKSVPDRPIMKQSRFGPPLVRQITDNPDLQPISSYWQEAETTHEKRQKWMAEMSRSPEPPLAKAGGCTKKVSFLETKSQP